MKIKIIFICMLLLMVTGCERNEINSLYVFFISGGQVYSVDSDGNNFTRLTNDSNTYISISSSTNGMILLLSDSTGKMYFMGYNGGNTNYFIDGTYGTYGPSGNIYFIKNNNTISRYNSDGSGSSDLLTLSSNTIYSLSCNKDETELSFGYSPGGPSYTARVDLTVLPYSYVNISGISNNVYPSYSPLSNEILGTMGSHTVIKIYTDNSYITLNSTSNLSATPAWSPDGEYVFFGKNTPDPKEIIRMKKDGSENKVIGTISTSISAFSVMGKPR